jgi:phage gpG-like protein
MAVAADRMDLNQFAAWAESAAQRAAGADPTKALKGCALLMERVTKENFAAGKAPDGTTWPPLKMARPRGGGQPLRDTGQLMASISAGGAGHVETIGSEELVYGTNLQYAGTQQDGDTILPKSGKALAIPRTPEALRAGSPRNFGQPLILIWGKGATHGGLFKKQGRRGKLILEYLLVPKAVIPARPFLGWNNEMAEGCANILGDWWAKEIGG